VKHKTIRKASKRNSPDETYAWLRDRMDKLGYSSLEQLAAETGINRGNIYRYFTQEQRPSVALVDPLCQVLKVSPQALLVGLGVWDRS
jgi:transcriptional regulator with XRE-family HTH domain